MTSLFGTRSSPSDHANVLTLCRESDAILLYLVEKYDPEHKLSVATFDEKIQLTQWLFFQASGQGCVPAWRCVASV